MSIFSEYDRYLFAEGRHCEIYKFLGAHLTKEKGKEGVSFAVWAPHAKQVFVTGDFDDWRAECFSMNAIGDGVWQIFVADVFAGMKYKYKIETFAGNSFLKADPMAYAAELRPHTASIVANIEGFSWTDKEWLANRPENSHEYPLNIYEVHLGSWKKNDQGGFLTYYELAENLPAYAKEMGYTHIEVMPLSEHPLDNSWGYQTTGYFAPTSRYGSAFDLMYFVDRCHASGIGVIMDWVPGHFCKDDHGLREFDGSFLYESDHPLRRDNDGWGTSYFDLSKARVRSFLISNACYWLEKFHIDGLRVDAVASMLYLDYTKSTGQWLPNEYGGRENINAIKFFREMNELIFARNPKVLMMAEESSSHPMVTWPVHCDGLGFNFKWNMGWMNDILVYMQKPTNKRRWHHEKLTFSLVYAFSENFVLPFSHDEVVHGKKSLLSKMPGEYWQMFANMRLVFGYMMAHPGKKLLFMGQEWGQFIEWDEKKSLDWFLLDYDLHRLLHDYVKELNVFYLAERCFWQVDYDWSGFCWLDPDDNDNSVVSFLRFDKNGNHIMVISNFTERAHDAYRVGVPLVGAYYEAFNSDEAHFGGSGKWGNKILIANPTPWHGQPNSLVVKLPPFSVLYIKAGYEKEG